MLRDLTRPSVGERAVKLLQAIAKATPRLGHPVVVGSLANPHWIASSWSIDQIEVSFLLKSYLQEQKNWIAMTPNRMGLTPAGYDHLDALRNAASTSQPMGFCAMWFAPEVVPVWTDAIKPAIEQAGYDALRIDGVEHNNRIDDEIMTHIRRSRFVVADFTGQRGGVYFEAGFALGLGRPVIWTVRSDALHDVHFDNRQYNFLQWNLNDLDDLCERLQYRIEATVGRGPLRY
jgi:nucleoside 2-deoxyribosyltransferase